MNSLINTSETKLVSSRLICTYNDVVRNARITYLIIIVALMTTTCRKSEVQKLAEAAALGELYYQEYKTADYDCAKAALLYFIKFNKKLIASPTTERQTYTADIMISYVRLAKLEESHRGSEKRR